LHLGALAVFESDGLIHTFGAPASKTGGLFVLRFCEPSHIPGSCILRRIAFLRCCYSKMRSLKGCFSGACMKYSYAKNGGG